MININNLIILSLFIIGCSKPVQIQSVDYYIAHIDEAQKIAKECNTLDKRLDFQANRNF